MDAMATTLRSTTIILHGRLADALSRQMDIVAPAQCSITDLRRAIADEHPTAAGAILSGQVRACVGEAIVSESYRPGFGEIVEFLPPVSGG